MLYQLFDAYRQNFTLYHRSVLVAAGIIGYKTLVNKVFNKPQDTNFVPVESLANGRTTILTQGYVNID